jgi:hypothetical protein
VAVPQSANRLLTQGFDQRPAKIIDRLSVGSQPEASATAILVPAEREISTMRPYITATSMALGLLAVWATLVQFVA